MDSDLKRRIEIFLQQKGVSSLPQLTIEVDGGHVLLQGTVCSFYERQLCLSCQHVAGVTRLVDDLSVELPSGKPAPPRSSSDAVVPVKVLD